MNPEEQALLERLFTYLPQLRRRYDFRQDRFVIFHTAASPKHAEEELKAWMFLVKEQALEAWFPFLETLQRDWPFILNFFKRHLTSGLVEGFNHKVRVLLWRSFGLFKLDRLFQRLCVDLEGPRVFGYPHLCWYPPRCPKNRNLRLPCSISGY